MCFDESNVYAGNDRRNNVKISQLALTTAASALSEVEAAQSSSSQTCSSTGEAGVVVERNLATLVVVPDVGVEVGLVGTADEASAQGDECGVSVNEVGLGTATTGTNTCTGQHDSWVSFLTEHVTRSTVAAEFIAQLCQRTRKQQHLMRLAAAHESWTGQQCHLPLSPAQQVPPPDGEHGSL